MKRHATSLLLLMVALGWAVACAPSPDGSSAESAGAPFEADWASLARHEAAPEWFRDSKLGIYFHWGVYSVPAFSTEWYPRLMHLPGHAVWDHHLATYGHPSEFGYHDFVPKFGAEHFDPEEWADLFQQAGARFAGPVAERMHLPRGPRDPASRKRIQNAETLLGHLLGSRKACLATRRKLESQADSLFKRQEVFFTFP